MDKKKMKSAVKRYGGPALAGVSAASNLTALYFTYKDSPKAHEAVQDLLNDYPDATRKDILWTIMKEMRRAEIAASIGLVAQVGSVVSYEGSLASAATVAAMAQKGMAMYQKATEDVVGAEKEKDIRAEAAKLMNEREDGETPFIVSGEKMWFRLTVSGYKDIWFEEFYENVLAAEDEYNRGMILRDYISWDYFFKYLGREDLIDDSMKLIGHSTWSDFSYGYRWVDFMHRKGHDKKHGDYIRITLPFEPLADYMNPNDD